MIFLITVAILGSVALWMTSICYLVVKSANEDYMGLNNWWFVAAIADFIMGIGVIVQLCSGVK